MATSPRYPTNPNTLHGEITTLAKHAVLVEGLAATDPTAPPAVLLENIYFYNQHVGSETAFFEVATWNGATWDAFYLEPLTVPASAGQGTTAPYDALATLSIENDPDGNAYGKMWDNSVRLRAYVASATVSVHVLVNKSDLEE